jgi:hypothetical protein
MSTTGVDPVTEPEPADPFVPAARLTWPQRAGRILIVGAFCVTAFAGAVVGLRNREPNDAFVQHQLHPAVVARADVEKHVRGKIGTSATCAPGGGALRNTWDCIFRSAGHRRIVEVRVDPDGAYRGTGDRRFRGCCVSVPIP